MTTIQLRDYQREAIDAIYTWFGRHTTNPLIVMPTGTGKSVVIAGFIEGVLRAYPGQRILVVTHVRELVEQNAKKLVDLWPDAPVGVYSAGLNRRDTEAQVIFAGIQSIANRAGELGWFDLVLVDEAHLIPRGGEGRYRTYLQALLSMNPAAKVIGFTATPFRTDSGSLVEGDERLFDGIAYTADMVRLIKAGYLSPLVPKRVDAEIDTRGVKKTAGEFNQAQLEQAALAGDNVQLACTEIVRWGNATERKSWLLFACGVKHGQEVERVMRDRGIAVASVFGDTPMADRDAITRRYKAGDLRCLVNCAVLTTGFDAPGTDLVAIMRPTCSAGLYVQMAGRGMRLAEGKRDCLVLDFGGNVDRHGPIDMVRAKKKGEGGGTAPVKTCPQCKSIVFAGAGQCPDCGFEFPRAAEPRHDIVANTRSIIAGLDGQRSEQRILQVHSTTYTRYQKAGDEARVSMLVEYHTGTNGVFSVREWIALEQRGYPRQVAENWWLRRGRPPVPASVQEALARTDELREVVSLKVEANGKYPKILGYAYADTPHQAGEARVPESADQGAGGRAG